MAKYLAVFGRSSACVCFALVLAASAAGVDLQVAPGDSPITISGKVGDDSTFIKRITLLAPKEAVPELTLFPGDLTDSAGAVIASSQIAVTSPAKIELPQNTPKIIEIKIAGVKIPGTYKGNLLFLQPGKGFTPVITVPIEVTAQVFPSLVLRKSGDTLKIQLIDCWRVGCWLARTLQPSASNGAYPVDFDNNGLNEYNVVLSATGQGETTHRPLSEVLQIPTQATVAPKPIYTLRIEAQGGAQVTRLLPDRYSGIVQLNPPHNEAPIKIPTEVDVRSGPLWPLVVLISGILVGRLLKYMKDKGGPQSDLLLRYYQLDARMSRQPADAQLLQTAMAAVKVRIYDMELDGAKADLDTLQNRWSVLCHLRQVEATLALYNGNPGVPAIVQSIQEARNLISQGQDVNAAAQIQQIDAAVRALAVPQGAAPQVATAYRSAVAFAAKAQTAAVATTTGPAKPAPYVLLISWITGMSDQVRAEGTLWVARPLLYVLLLVALVVVGISQLYMKNPIFGSDPLADYFGIAAWGMSSDVASRSLTSIKLGS
jgi:hypothetical protein